MTPLFYAIDDLPDKLQWFIKHFNPMYFYIGQFRDIIYYNRMPGHMIIFAGCAAAAIMLIIGVISFVKNQDKFILYI